MKARQILKMLLAGLSIFLFLSIPYSAIAGPREWSDEEFSLAFDEVARNYGAAEYAVYTFMIEFGRSPSSLTELMETGHLNVQMTNPYTGGDVISLSEADFPDGDLEGNLFLSSPRENGEETHLEAWFLRNEDGTIMVRSMVKRIYIYHSEIDYNYFFNNDLPRDEQFVAVYCRQAIDAFDSFMQRNGRSAENFDDMYENGDVNVHYINPITGELAVPSEEISPGDFYYEKIDEDGFCFIGWGRERPVFFACTDEQKSAEFYLAWPELVEQEVSADNSGDNVETPNGEGGAE
ncbi:MAG: hypothetical protein NTY09_06560 [bacterium]|nr:hypothetical protein [bacterium]